MHTYVRDSMVSTAATLVVVGAMAFAPTALAEPITQDFDQTWPTTSSYIDTFVLTDGTPSTFVKTTRLSSVVDTSDGYIDPVAAVECELADYASLSDGWDGDESVAPSSFSLAQARLLLGHLPGGIPFPQPMLSSEGEVGFYWNSKVAFADLSIKPDGTFSLYLKDKRPSGEESFFDAIPVDEGARSYLAQRLALFSRA